MAFELLHLLLSAPSPGCIPAPLFQRSSLPALAALRIPVQQLRPLGPPSSLFDPLPAPSLLQLPRSNFEP